MFFTDRAEAGRRLAQELERLNGLRDAEPVVIGLARGGLPVAAEVAAALDAPLDVGVVRKLGVPSQPELGMGAIGEDGVRVINDEVVRLAGASSEALARVEARERTELERRAHDYRRGRERTDLTGRTAVLVDDGIATGSTARAACRSARRRGAARVVLAVPVAPRGWEERLGEDADDLVAVDTPRDFMAVGQFYADFAQTGDEEVIACLDEAAGRTGGAGPEPRGESGAGTDTEVAVGAGDVTLQGRLTVPPGASGVVVFVHGSGSSRHSPRNRYVAGVLQEAGLGTLLFDLLTEAEERDRANVFDTGLLARRLSEVIGWLKGQPAAQDLPVGCFGASTGAGAALWLAADRPGQIAAVVSRGGRPDLAGPRLADVRTPVLLVVGGQDPVVLDLNRQALAELGTRESRLAVVPGATHLFEEPGTLEEAAALARDWFTGHLAAPPAWQEGAGG